MKKRYLLFFIVLMSVLFIGCDSETTTINETMTTRAVTTEEATTVSPITTTTTQAVTTEEETYTLNIMRPDDSTITITDIEFGERIRLDNLGRPGYTFIGFSYDGLMLNNPFDYNYTEDITITAMYEQNVHTVEFRDYDDTVLEVVTVADGSNLLNINNPSRDGYTFIGWNMDLTNIRSDLIVTAIYEINVYDVIFQDEDGTLLCFSPTEYLDSPAEPEQPPTKPGFTWGGWDTDYSSITSDLVITATYIPITYTISFNTDGGDPIDNITAHYGDVIDLTSKFYITVKTDNNFIGWLNDEDIVTSVTVSDDLVLYAMWEDALEYFDFEDIGSGIRINSYIGTDSEVVIPDTYGGLEIIQIGSDAFIDNNYIEEVYIGRYVTTISDGAFMSCNNLKAVILSRGSQLNFIGLSAFDSCSNLRSINLEVITGNLAISGYAFSDNMHLKHIYIPENTTLIMDYAFYGCENLSIFYNDNPNVSMWEGNWNVDNLQTEDRITDFGEINGLMYAIDSAFGAIILGKAYNSDITDIVIPNEISSIPVNFIYIDAFNSEDIHSVYIPNTVTTILYRAFQNCFNLESVNLEEGSSLSTIRDEAFANCINLSSINLENAYNLFIIDNHAFFGCDLDYIIIPITVWDIGANVFVGNDDLVIYCEADSLPTGWDPLWNSDGYIVYWNYYIN